MTWLIGTLFATGALIALVLALRGPVARWFGPGMAYALWALPLLRLVLPPLTLPALVPDAVPLLLTNRSMAAAAGTEPAPVAAWNVAELLIPVWLAGVAAYLVWRTIGYGLMRRRILAEARAVGAIGSIRLVESPEAGVPVAFGLFDRVVALPLGFLAQSDTTRRDLAIAHELEHHSGRDLAVNFAVQPLLALHWFNPLAWLGWRALRRDQEAACDARVLAHRDPASREAYARLILGFAQSPFRAPALPLACPVLGEKNVVHRLRSLSMTQPSLRARLLGRALIAAGVLALPLTATISYAESDDPPAAPAASASPQVEVTKRIIIVDHPGGATLAHGAIVDDANLHTRVIERNGRTIILKTTRELTDAEAEEHIARAEGSIPDIPDAPTPPDVPDAPDGAHREHRMVMVRSEVAGGPGTATAVVSGDAAVACAGGGDDHTVRAEETRDGERHVRIMRFCNHGGTSEQALAGLRAARERLAASDELGDETKREVLEEIDREIERLSRPG